MAVQDCESADGVGNWKNVGDHMSAILRAFAFMLPVARPVLPGSACYIGVTFVFFDSVCAMC